MTEIIIICIGIGIFALRMFFSWREDIFVTTPYEQEQEEYKKKFETMTEEEFKKELQECYSFYGFAYAYNESTYENIKKQYSELFEQKRYGEILSSESYELQGLWVPGN